MFVTTKFHYGEGSKSLPISRLRKCKLSVFCYILTAVNYVKDYKEQRYVILGA